MALEKTIKGKHNADISYHMIPNGTLTKNVVSNTYKVDFNLVSYVDKTTRDTMPNVGHHDSRSYTMPVTEEQMAHIIDHLGLYPYVKANDANFSDATDVL